MDTTSSEQPQKKGDFTSTSRLLILQGLVPIATNLVSSQLEAFAARLAEALYKLSEQTIRPEEAATSFQSFQLLSRNSTAFYRLVAGQINASLAKEVSTINVKKKAKKDDVKKDFSLVSFEEMESKVLSRNLSQILETTHSDVLMALNIRIGNVLRRTPINVAQNPFRPEMFVNAVYQAWTEFDTTPESHHIVLRLLQPNLFLYLAPILNGLNDALIQRGILPDLSDVYQSKQSRNRNSRGDDTMNSDPYLHNKLRSLFFGAEGADDTQGGQPGQLNFSGAHGVLGSQHQQQVIIDREFFDYLTSLQRVVRRTDFSTIQNAPMDSSPLRQLVTQAPKDQISNVDQSTIELLARIFDFVFKDPSIPEDIKKLIGQLQIPPRAA